jgi:L-threonylcarbamoyladenylate synthase
MICYMEQQIITQLATNGTIGIIPTDTVYGVVARAIDQAAVQRLYMLKHREHKPGTIIAATIDQLVTLGLKRRYLSAVAQFWPGAVSVIIPCGPELAYLHQGQLGLAVRIPADKTIHSLLEQTGPLLTSSANQPGQPTSVTIAQAKTYFGQEVDFYIDGGDLSDHQPSTIIQVIDDAVTIIRQGVVQIPL